MLDTAWATPVADPAATELLAAVSRFCARPKVGRPPRALSEELIQLRHACDRLEVEFSETAGLFAATDEYDVRGSNSSIDWIRHECRMSGHTAAERVSVGLPMARMPQTVEAVRDGRIGYGHLALVARTAEALPVGELARPPGGPMAA